MKKKETNSINDNDAITVENVDIVVRRAITHYADNGLTTDAMFWGYCMRLLQEKYKFKLAAE